MIAPGLGESSGGEARLVSRTSQQARLRSKQSMTRETRSRRHDPGRRARLRYLFDASMSRGTPALVGWLALVSLVMVLVFSVIVYGLGLGQSDGPGFFRQFFSSILHVIDTGTVAGDQGSWYFLLVMLVLTLGGLFIVSALIGVISAGIDDRLAELRRGRSTVIESGHTVVLGWSPSIFTVVRELSLANESRRRPVVVVLADRDKVEMEEEIREKVPDLRGTRVVVRSGSPIDLGDLARSSPTTARSIIVLSPETEDPDSEVIKTLLALSRDQDGPPVVAEIQDPDNLEAARIAGGQRALVVDKRETSARLILQTARQSGVAAVYTELFDYDGDEIYFHVDAALRTATYAEAVLAYESVSVIGLLGPDGTATLNPAPDTVVGEHTLIVVAEDDSVLTGDLGTSTTPDRSAIIAAAPVPEAPSNTLLIGWNDRAEVILRELDSYAAPGSRLTVLSDHTPPPLPSLANLETRIAVGRTTDRATLAEYVGAGLDQVVVLCYSDRLPVQQADARTLITLLHVRHLIGSTGEGPTLVSELLDDRNRALAQVAHVEDVIVSDEILSRMITQLAEDARLAPVFADLLDADGAEIYLRPAQWYVEPDREVSVATIAAAAMARGETAFGYWRVALAPDAEAGYGIRVNPPKSATVRFGRGDRVIVLADR
jgi:ion channel POLLUX/CASTOR